MSRTSETYFEQIPIEIVRKIAKLEIPDADEIKARKKTKRKVKRTISDAWIRPEGVEKS